MILKRRIGEALVVLGGALSLPQVVSARPIQVLFMAGIMLAIAGLCVRSEA